MACASHLVAHHSVSLPSCVPDPACASTPIALATGCLPGQGHSQLRLADADGVIARTAHYERPEHIAGVGSAQQQGPATRTPPADLSRPLPPSPAAQKTSRDRAATSYGTDG